jgi:hypothetical protein
MGNVPHIVIAVYVYTSRCLTLGPMVHEPESGLISYLTCLLLILIYYCMSLVYLHNCVYGPLPEHNNDGDSDGDEGLVHFHAEDRFGKAPMHVRHVYFQPATQNGRTRKDQRWR